MSHYIQSNIFTKNVQKNGKVTHTHSGATTKKINAATHEMAKYIACFLLKRVADSNFFIIF